MFKVAQSYVQQYDVKSPSLVAALSLVSDQLQSKLHSSPGIYGSLGRHVEFWEKIGANATVVDWLKTGFVFPFTCPPPRMFAPNNLSARRNSHFVSEEISRCVKAGFCQPVNRPPWCVSPLTVAENGSKLRLVLDMSVVNQFIAHKKFRIEDINCVLPFLSANGYMCSFDLKQGYYHVPIHPNQWKYLGFRWGNCFFVFKVLVFGCKSGPFVFTKIMRCLVKRWRALGLPIVIYIDDGVLALPNWYLCSVASCIVRIELSLAGFFTKPPKCNWSPRQVLEWTGIWIELRNFCLFIPERRIKGCLTGIREILGSQVTTARRLASVVGKLISMTVVLGSNTQLMTRSAHLDIVLRSSWDGRLRISTNTWAEVMFWKKRLVALNHRSLRPDTLVAQWCFLMPARKEPGLQYLFKVRNTCAPFVGVSRRK
ncbi:MAG: hypothetical protein GY696_30075, partial [Gammaproteobacteria bacterium]|nr:hypothetical protein [Gammaproteobacteria bacterium]